jgi:hypothetical protein
MRHWTFGDWFWISFYIVMLLWSIHLISERMTP